MNKNLLVSVDDLVSSSMSFINISVSLPLFLSIGTWCHVSSYFRCCSDRLSHCFSLKSFRLSSHRPILKVICENESSWKSFHSHSVWSRKSFWYSLAVGQRWWSLSSHPPVVGAVDVVHHMAVIVLTKVKVVGVHPANGPSPVTRHLRLSYLKERSQWYDGYLPQHLQADTCCRVSTRLFTHTFTAHRSQGAPVRQQNATSANMSFRVQL